MEYGVTHSRIFIAAKILRWVIKAARQRFRSTALHHFSKERTRYVKRLRVLRLGRHQGDGHVGEDSKECKHRACERM